MPVDLPRGIGGYAVRWREWSCSLPAAQAAAGGAGGDFRERFLPGAFTGFLRRLAAGGAVVELQDEHDGPPFASTADGTLAVWEDHYGLAFAAELLCEPRYAAVAVSMMFDAPRGGVAWDGPAATVRAAELQHIALIRPREGAAGAYAGAVAWFTEWPSHAVPPAVASLQARWTVGRARSMLPPPAARRSAPALPPHIIALLAQVGRERAADPHPMQRLWWLHPADRARALALARM